VYAQATTSTSCRTGSGCRLLPYRIIGAIAKLFANSYRFEKGEKIVTGRDTFRIDLPDIRFFPIFCKM
jgi:hypothetical protein